MEDEEEAKDIRKMSKNQIRKNLHKKDKDIIDRVNSILDNYKFKSGDIDKDNAQLAEQMMQNPILKANLMNYYKIEDIEKNKDVDKQI